MTPEEKRFPTDSWEGDRYCQDLSQHAGSALSLCSKGLCKLAEKAACGLHPFSITSLSALSHGDMLACMLSLTTGLCAPLQAPAQARLPSFYMDNFLSLPQSLLVFSRVPDHPDSCPCMATPSNSTFFLIQAI